jgi:hypothetical protein
MRIKFFAQEYAWYIVGIPIGFALIYHLLGALGVDMPLTREECESKAKLDRECWK